MLTMGPDLQYADEHPLNPLTLQIYPGTGSWTLYEDDGHTYDYERGSFSTTEFALQLTGTRLTLEIGPRAGAYNPPHRKIHIYVNGPGTWTLQPNVAMASPAQGSPLEVDDAPCILTWEHAP
ncbi:MAG: hypothetical protein NVSMB42_24190 [Herpetosiphon sp.]